MRNNSTEFVAYPTSERVSHYQQLSHKLRNAAFSELLSSISAFLQSRWSVLQNRWLQHKLVTELESLNSFMLKDIGLTRADIDRLRDGSITVETLNQRRFNYNKNRFEINKKIELRLCNCHHTIPSENLVECSVLAKCG